MHCSTVFTAILLALCCNNIFTVVSARKAGLMVQITSTPTPPHTSPPTTPTTSSTISTTTTDTSNTTEWSTSSDTTDVTGTTASPITTDNTGTTSNDTSSSAGPPITPAPSSANMIKSVFQLSNLIIFGIVASFLYL